MKWFKHLSSARDDERIAELEDIAGLEGYAMYFKLLEIVAASMDQTDRCSVIYSVSRWATLTNCHPIKARTLVGKVGSCGLVEARFEEGRIEVTIPNLLKHRDNHTKNLQVACKQEVEVEVDKNIHVRKPIRSAVALPLKFVEFWNLYPGPRKVQKGKCLELWRKGLEDIADQVLAHLVAISATPDWQKDGGQFIPAPVRYLKERRWEDGLPDRLFLVPRNDEFAGCR